MIDLDIIALVNILISTKNDNIIKNMNLENLQLEMSTSTLLKWYKTNL